MPEDKHYWPENSWPTPEQWLAFFKAQTPERQLEVAAQVCRNAETAARCLDFRHSENIHRMAGQIFVRDHTIMRLRFAWKSSRRRARSLRLTVDQLIDDAARARRPSQSAPESLPGGDGMLIASHRIDRMPEEASKLGADPQWGLGNG